MGEDDNLAGCGFFDKPVRHLFAPLMIEGCHRVIEHQRRVMLGRRQFGEERGESDAGLLTLAQAHMDLRTEERRVGNECDRTCSSRWTPTYQKNTESYDGQ